MMRDVSDKKSQLKRLCRQQKASFDLVENDMIIHCTNLSQYNIVLGMAHRIGKFVIETSCDWRWEFRGDIIIRFA